MRAGLLDRRVALQSKAAPSDGDPTSGAWTTQATVYAHKIERSQVERFVSDQTLAEGGRAYLVRHRTDVDPTWRVNDGGELWNVEGVYEGEGRRTETVLVCSRYDPNDEE